MTTGFPAFSAASDERPRRLDAADQLHDDVDVEVDYDAVGVVGEASRRRLRWRAAFEIERTAIASLRA